MRDAAKVARLLAFVALAAAGCGPRTTFDPYDKLAFAPVKLAPAIVAEEPRLAGDLARAYEHYVAYGGLFREVSAVTGSAASADATTVLVDAQVVRYVPDEGRWYGKVVGGRARGNALIRYAFRNLKGDVLWEEDIVSVARSGAGSFGDVPEPLGGVDAAVEGAAAELHWWLRRNKSNPRQVAAPEPKE